MRTRRAALPIAICAALVLILTSCHSQRLGQDIYSLTDGNGDVYYQQLNEHPAVGAVPIAEGISHIYYDINANCGPSGNDANGSWGTADTDRTDNSNPNDDLSPNTTMPDSTMVNCAIDHFQYDDQEEDDPASLVCDDYGTDADCQDADASLNYVVNNDNTDFYRSAFSTTTEMQWLLAGVRDFMAGTTIDDNGPNQSPGAGAPGCIAIRQDGNGPAPLNGTHKSTLARACL